MDNLKKGQRLPNAGFAARWAISIIVEEAHSLCQWANEDSKVRRCRQGTATSMADFTRRMAIGRFRKAVLSTGARATVGRNDILEFIARLCYGNIPIALSMKLRCHAFFAAALR
jgi:hypothetical protein